MRQENHFALLREGVQAWNRWRAGNQGIRPELRRADLRRAELGGANLRDADLSGAVCIKARLGRADLRGASLAGAKLTRAVLRKANLGATSLRGADLGMADLRQANLDGADLTRAGLRSAKLTGATLRRAELTRADLLGAILNGADLTGAVLSETVFADTEIKGVHGLADCRHRGPSILDHRTLQRSEPLPVGFLRGCGLPDNWIDYIPALVNQPIQHYSCFISYSSADEAFSQRLYADLQNHGVRCWFAPEDMKIGSKILDTLDEAIRLRDKVLLILSGNAIASDWVEDEVTKAYAEERARRQIVLFPIRIDDAVKETREPWAAKLQDSRHIGDFRKWKDHDAYQAAFRRLLRDLEVEGRQPDKAGMTANHDP